MGSKILAFRMAVVVDRLTPRNESCPLSLRDLLGAPLSTRCVLPIVRAPIAGVARGALVAAREADAAIGLALPPGTPAEPWFEAVTAAADEVAAGLPIFLCSEVTVQGAAGADVDRAELEAFRLVDAGITHLAVDVRGVPPAERARVFAAVAAPAAERGACVDCLVALEDAPGALFSELARLRASPDVVSVRCPVVEAPKEVRAQVVRLVRLCAELSGVPIVRRGPVSPALLAELARSPVRGCEDGGAAAVAGIAVIPWERLQQQAAGETRTPALERAAEELSRDAADRLEARAYVEVATLIERLGAAGSGGALVEALERQLAER
ncbi:MAG TPA: hypothetical protein VLT61_14840 [Anaeromyxobacteraceae bacterium]|nr:hypothetical protein [Anaeromyxobacteraceae bacterium]